MDKATAADSPASAEHLVIACSLSPSSRSTALGQRLLDALAELGLGSRMIELRHLELPFCDGDRYASDSRVIAIREQITAAASVTMAVPVYNFDVAASARNLIALAGGAWREKVVAFLAAAGGSRSYMATIGLANSLMLDHRARIIPRFVYDDGSAGGARHPELDRRIVDLALDLERFSAFEAWLAGRPDREAPRSPTPAELARALSR
jgi:FMN reductase